MAPAPHALLVCRVEPTADAGCLLFVEGHAPLRMLPPLPLEFAELVKGAHLTINSVGLSMHDRLWARMVLPGTYRLTGRKAGSSAVK